jgi:hypothetical protein
LRASAFMKPPARRAVLHKHIQTRYRQWKMKEGKEGIDDAIAETDGPPNPWTTA